MKVIECNSSNKRLLTRPIYNQCLWIVKDYPRLFSLVDLQVVGNQEYPGEVILYADDKYGLISEEVIKEARHKLICIEESIKCIPEELRKGILDNIVEGKQFSDYPSPNTWKRWKHVFIETLAKKLYLY